MRRGRYRSTEFVFFSWIASIRFVVAAEEVEVAIVERLMLIGGKRGEREERLVIKEEKISDLGLAYRP